MMSIRVDLCLGVPLGCGGMLPVMHPIRTRGEWRTNVQWPGMITLELPNGDVWDACSFGPLAPTWVDPVPVSDEETMVLVQYTGYVPPGLLGGMMFPFLLNTVKR
jgi:hypothetical protein